MTPASTTIATTLACSFASERADAPAPRRFEHKYLVPESLLPSLRQLVSVHARADRHASPNGGDDAQGYVVRTLYLDTPGLTHYHETDDGVEVRVKPRIRAYGAPGRDATVFLELKRRHGGVGSKTRVRVAWHSLSALLSTGNVARYVGCDAAHSRAADAARRFLFHLRHDALRLVLLVVYDREPWVGRIEPTLRVTFDRHVRSIARPRLEGLFDERGARRDATGRFVLEVKYDASFGFPRWLRPFIARHGLTRQAHSKYLACATDHGLARGSMVHGCAAIP